jgi:hypothetical protein
MAKPIQKSIRRLGNQANPEPRRCRGPQDPSRLELECMKAIWSDGAVTVLEVLQRRTNQLAGNDGLPVEISGAWSLLAVLLPQAFAETNVQTEGTFCISGCDDGGIIIHTVFHNNHLLVVR